MFLFEKFQRMETNEIKMKYFKKLAADENPISHEKPDKTPEKKS